MLSLAGWVPLVPSLSSSAVGIKVGKMLCCWHQGRKEARRDALEPSRALLSPRERPPPSPSSTSLTYFCTQAKPPLGRNALQPSFHRSPVGTVARRLLVSPSARYRQQEHKAGAQSSPPWSKAGPAGVQIRKAGATNEAETRRSRQRRSSLLLSLASSAVPQRFHVDLPHKLPIYEVTENTRTRLSV